MLQYFYRLKRIDNLIRRRATGPPEAFARRLGISRSVLMENLKELKEYGIPIEYSKTRQSYYYSIDGEIIFKFMAKNPIKI